MTKKQQQSAVSKLARLFEMHRRVDDKMSADLAAVETKINELIEHVEVKRASLRKTRAAHRDSAAAAINTAIKAGLPMGVALAVGQSKKV